jgi:hypothetical protein
MHAAEPCGPNLQGERQGGAELTTADIDDFYVEVMAREGRAANGDLKGPVARGLGSLSDG